MEKKAFESCWFDENTIESVVQKIKSIFGISKFTFVIKIKNFTPN